MDRRGRGNVIGLKPCVECGAKETEPVFVLSTDRDDRIIYLCAAHRGELFRALRKRALIDQSTHPK